MTPEERTRLLVKAIYRRREESSDRIHDYSVTAH